MPLFPLCFAAGALLVLNALAETPRILKADFPRFIGTVPCQIQESLCPQALLGFSRFGLSGDEGFEDPNGFPKDSTTGKPPLALGFPDDKTVEWAKYTFDSPLNRHIFVLLNEVSSSGANHVMLSEWKMVKGSMEWVRLLPQVYELPLGIMTVAGKPQRQGAGFLVLLQGRGSDAGVNTQDYRVLRFDARGNPAVIESLANRSEIPVADILARLNDDQAAEEVTDSSLVCALAPGGKALRCTKSLTRIRYTKAGPEENPLGKQDFSIALPKAKAK